MSSKQVLEQTLAHLTADEQEIILQLLLVISRNARPLNSQPHHDSPYLTAEEAAAYCRIGLQTLYNHRHEIERMPGLGRKLLFRRESLDKWLENRRKRRAGSR